MFKRLVIIRKQHNLSCEDIANILNISSTYYWQLEHGKRRLFYKQAIEIAKIFNLRPDDIFFDDLK